MIVELYSIKDELSEYAPPLPMKDEENAKRYFNYKLVTDDFMKMSPKDYSIWRVGVMDTETGIIKCFAPELTQRGYDNGNEEVEL